jgi:hypothetical protein
MSAQSWPVDLLSLANIRSLSLAHCSQEQFKQLVNQRQLTRLSLPCDDSSWDFLERFVLGNEGEERFPQLHSIGRIWCGYTNFKGSSSKIFNTMIRHIHLVVPTCRSSVNFIQDLPELSLITVDYLGSEVGFSSSCFISAKIRRQGEGGLKNISPKKDPPSQSMDEKNMPLVTIAPRVYRLRINFLGQCDFVGLARILQRCSILERVQIRIKYYPKELDLVSIRQLSPFFLGLTFGDVHKATGNPVIVAKWPL